MELTVVTAWALAVFLLTLRLSAVFVFAPPFSLLNVPLRIRVLFPIGLAVAMVQLPGAGLPVVPMGLGEFTAAAAGELLIGLGIAFAFLAAFGALYFAGRVLDVQAGFGLATVIDPATRAQSPLIGTLFVLGASAVFFAVDGHHDLLRLLAASLVAVPLGAASMGWTLQAVVAHAGSIFVLGLLTAGAAMLVLFMTDVAIGFMSRTLPQMNILILGLQVKSIVLILALVLLSGLLAPAFLRATEAGLRFIAAME